MGDVLVLCAGAPTFVSVSNIDGRNSPAGGAPSHSVWSASTGPGGVIALAAPISRTRGSSACVGEDTDGAMGGVGAKRMGVTMVGPSSRPIAPTELTPAAPQRWHVCLRVLFGHRYGIKRHTARDDARQVVYGGAARTGDAPTQVASVDKKFLAALWTEQLVR